jgi:glycosyltransferase involved in cell wall biosynthesis
VNLTVDLRMYRHSGIGRYLRNLFPLLLPLVEADTVRVWGRRAVMGEAGWLDDPRVRMVETEAQIYSVSEQLLAAKAGIRGEADGVLWVPHFNAPLWYAGRMVVTIHDIAPLAMPQILGSRVKRAYARLLIERAVQQAAAILCVSAFTQRELVETLHVPVAKTTVTLPGLDADWPASAVRHVEVDGLPYLLFVGNVKPNKNVAALLEALTMVLERIPHRLVIVGRVHGMGTGDAAVVRRAEALGGRVRFAGEVDDATLQRLYAGAAALVMPSLYEGFGLPLLEAMQLGCPVLAATGSSLPEVAGEAALLFDPLVPRELAERLLQVQDAACMEGLRVRGLARVRQFSFERCAQQTAAVMNRRLQGEEGER